MNLSPQTKNIVIEIICLLYVLLFVYATVSKLLDIENFEVQLGQSPLLSPFAWWVAWMIPSLELLTAFLLILPRFRSLGLFAALGLMTMFTVYIFIILHFSSFVPCSCGGILEKMSWNTHLVFNVLCILCSVIALVFHFDRNIHFPVIKKLALIRAILVTAVLSSAVIITLFIFSENIIYNENPFIRRYPQHPIMMTFTKDLKFNSYYFAGYHHGRIYLGNSTTPLKLIALDSRLEHPQTVKISFETKKRPFQHVRILIRGNFFYLMDGTVPAIYRGSILDWKISKELKGCPYFNLAEPVDSLNILLRSNIGRKSVQAIGVFSPEKDPKILYNKNFLRKQIDGVFDTDGTLLYGDDLKKAVYIYYYRNEFIISDPTAKVLSRKHTIDTNSTAKIKVAYLKEGTERTMSAPPLMVNQHSALYGNLLFVHSKIKGKYEDAKLWEQASIIDVYDVEKGSYLMSFAVYGTSKKKLHSFYVTATHLYALIGDQIVAHELRPILKNKFHFLENNNP
jgi:uncharacterized membrane protein YphA (DoxX/SURF4 family)